MPLPTICVVHPKEKRSKCSIEPLRGLPGFEFWTYPKRGDANLANYVRLGIGGELLTSADAGRGLLLLDGTWRWAARMEADFADVPVRSLLPWRTAYPRVSKLFEDPTAGLATIEALFAAQAQLGRSTEGLLDSYRWREEFLEINAELIATLRQGCRTDQTLPPVHAVHPPPAPSLQREGEHVPRLAGIVLCGGASRRMGSPKHLLKFGAETALERIVRLVGEVASPVIVVAGPDHELPPLPPDVPVVRDERPHEGPLMGLRNGLAALPADVEAAFATGCDSPLLVPGVIRLLWEKLGPEDECVVPADEAHRYPLLAVYRRRVLAAADQLLASGERRLLALVERVRTAAVSVEDLRCVDPRLQSLRNVNTAAEYGAANQSISARS